MIDKIAKHFNFQQQALGLRSYRNEVLASNIANSETPYYKSVVFDFNKTLAQAELLQKKESMSMEKTHQSHLQGKVRAVSLAELQYRREVQPSIDGNTVDMDLERTQFTDNSMRYQTTLTFLNRRISGLSDAIKGQ